METKRITVRGVDFAYLEAGEGPLVLCLHGFPDHAPTWEPLLRDLAAAGFRGVAPWMRGYSPTGTAERYHTQELALDAIALTEALGSDGDAYLVGSDWGAGAVHLAVPHKPDLWKRCVTMAVPPGAATGAFLSSPGQWKRSWYVWFFGTPLADIAFPQADYGIVDQLWADWSPDFTPETAFIRALKDIYAVDGGQAAMGYYRDSFHQRRPLSEEAATLTGGPMPIPMLYFHGTNDGCLGIDLVDESILTDSLGPGGDSVFVEGAGHFMHLEKPDEVNPKVIEFLKA
jgi:pimeloyl-ACP methyl ester carboxylesterase